MTARNKVLIITFAFVLSFLVWGIRIERSDQYWYTFGLIAFLICFVITLLLFPRSRTKVLVLSIIFTMFASFMAFWFGKHSHFQFNRSFDSWRMPALPLMHYSPIGWIHWYRVWWGVFLLSIVFTISMLQQWYRSHIRERATRT
jgi:hypothetical protein